MFSAHGGGGCGLSAADALKEAADSAATGPDYKDDDTPPSVVVDSKALWSLSCGSSALQPPATLRPSVARQRRGTKEIEAAPVLLRTIASTKEGGSPGSLLRRAVSGSASANASGSGSPINLRPPSPTSPTLRALRLGVPPPGAVFANLPEVERRPDEACPRPAPPPPPPPPPCGTRTDKPCLCRNMPTIFRNPDLHSHLPARRCQTAVVLLKPLPLAPPNPPYTPRPLPSPRP